jgi:hypothetical protein
MPLRAVQMLGVLRDRHGKSCSMEQANDAAVLFSFNREQVTILLQMFKHLGMVLHFPEVSGCDDIIVLEVQWLIDVMSCLIREEELHGSLLQDLLEDDPSDHLQVWHRTPNGVVWNEDDIKNGWFPVGLLEYIWGHTKKYNKLAATETELEFLKKVLTHFHLVNRVSRDGDLFFVVPALVPMAPKVPAPPLLENSNQSPQMPASVAWQLHRVRQQHGSNVGVFDFTFDFEDEGFFPDDLFESLLCAVATNILCQVHNKEVRFLVDFYRHEATFAFNEHYIHAKKHQLSMQVYCINYGAGNYTTSQYSLNLFRECANNLLQNIDYNVNLGYVDNGNYAYQVTINERHYYHPHDRNTSNIIRNNIAIINAIAIRDYHHNNHRHYNRFLNLAPSQPCQHLRSGQSHSVWISAPPRSYSRRHWTLLTTPSKTPQHPHPRNPHPRDPHPRDPNGGTGSGPFHA